MNYLSVAEMAKKWNISERTVRNYCASGKIPGAFLTGKTWNIPDNAERPDRINKKSNMPETLLDRLYEEKTSHTKGGIYHNCLAEYLGCTVDELLDKIEEFKEEGCKLFL